MNTQVSLLNTLYKKLWQEPDLLTAQVDCTRCSRGDLSAPRRWSAYKCCTFQPFVSSVLAGAMLEDGLKPLDIANAKAVLLPIGVIATAEFRDQRTALHEDHHGAEQLCSYYDSRSRSCKVWRLRPGECSLHFCTPDAKREQISSEIFQFEAGVAQMALVNLGFSLAEIDQQLEYLNDPKPGVKSLEASDAQVLYSRAWSWFKTVTPEELRSWQRFDFLKPAE